MRPSFLIRDILSGSAAAAAAAASAESPNTSHIHNGSNLSLNHHHNPQQSAPVASNAVSPFELAATQARFLAKLAENQQQVSASKYYEHLQQQHHQLLNLNMNLSQHHLQLQLQHQLQHQQQQLHLHHHHHQQQQQQKQKQQHDQHSTSQLPAESTSSSSSHSAINGNGGASVGPRKKEKTSSFAYDCASPISSISDVEADARQEEHEEGEEAANESHGEGEDEEEEEEEEEVDIEDVAGESTSETKRQRVGESQNGRRTSLVSSSSSSLALQSREPAGQIRRSQAGACSSSGASEDLNEPSDLKRLQHEQEQLFAKQQLTAPFQLNSPLDALFQMTSSTFDALKRGEKRKDRESNDPHGSSNFTSKQASKKKRKSRTAFTNPQIFELERRFRVQKYLSPTDRDEIAMTLNLSNAQVITWFQNRRAKLKRDLEEQKRDIETASLLSLHNTLVAYSQMKTASDKNFRM